MHAPLCIVAIRRHATLCIVRSKGVRCRTLTGGIPPFRSLTETYTHRRSGFACIGVEGASGSN
jgi:hypothetical protein